MEKRKDESTSVRTYSRAKKGKEEEDFAAPPAIFAPSLAARSEIRH